MFDKILGALRENPHVVGGACRMAFKNTNIKTGIVAGLNNLRAMFTGISFGDQAQFFRIEGLDQMGGFPELMLMEDVELSLRLKQTGRLLFLKERVIASGRRWKAGSFTNNFLKVIRLFVFYLIDQAVLLCRLDAIGLGANHTTLPDAATHPTHRNLGTFLLRPESLVCILL